MQCGLNNTGIYLQTLQDRDIILLLENKLKRGTASSLGDRYVKSDEYKKTLYIDANNLYGSWMNQYLLYDEIENGRYVNLEDIIKTPDVSEFGYFDECDLKYPVGKKTKKEVPFCSEKKVDPQDKITGYINEMKPKFLGTT